MPKYLGYIAVLFLLLGCASETIETPSPDALTQNGGKTDQFLDGQSSDVPAENDLLGSDVASTEESTDLTTSEESGSDVSVEPVANPFAPALDINLHLVSFPEDLEAPNYDYPRVDSGFFLSGTEFWQKWPGGENPTYSYSEGSDYGRRCMYASALRFQALMENPPESMVQLRDESKWSGSFFNWNDDYGNEASWGDGSSARLWAWRTSLIKWISQTNQDGSCYLPTLDMLEILATDCKEEAEYSDGEIQGCRAP
mgnify:CR=1 FL=1